MAMERIDTGTYHKMGSQIKPFRISILYLCNFTMVIAGLRGYALREKYYGHSKKWT